MPEIHRAFEEGKIDDTLITEDDIESIFNGEYSEFERHTQDPLDHFSRKEIEYLHSLHYAKKGPEKRRTEPKKEKIGRNDPCPCGSGKKYKKCCMGKEGTAKGY